MEQRSGLLPKPLGSCVNPHGLGDYPHPTAEAAETAVAETAERIKKGFLCVLGALSGESSDRTITAL